MYSTVCYIFALISFILAWLYFTTEDYGLVCVASFSGLLWLYNSSKGVK